MKKGFILGFALLFCVSAGVFSQNMDFNPKFNAVQVDLGMVYDGSGSSKAYMGARYEFMLTNKISAGVSVSSSSFISGAKQYTAFGRWYPWGGAFYAELGAGYGEVKSMESPGSNKGGFLVYPGFGWKVHLSPSIYLNPMMHIPFLFGVRITTEESTICKIGVGLGYAF